jgi:ELWxxDGT repeat protein
MRSIPAAALGHSRPAVADRLEPRLHMAAHLVIDGSPGPSDSAPLPLGALGDTMLFAMGGALWRTDGTAGGTTRLAPVSPVSELPLDTAVANGRVFFVVSEIGTPLALWASDGTAAGTVRLHDLFNEIGIGSDGGDAYDPRRIVASGGNVYFRAPGGSGRIDLWKTDGTPAGTTRVRTFADSLSSARFTGADVNGTFYFTARDESTGYEIWSTDGTEAGTRVLDLSPGPANSVVHSLTNLNGSLFFGGTLTPRAGPQVSGVFDTDGTAAGTTLLAPVYLDRRKFQVERVGAYVYFPASLQAPTQLEPWRSDGTPDGTVQVADIMPNAAPSNPYDLTKVGADRLFFFADGGEGRKGLYVIDAPAAAPRFVAPVFAAHDGVAYPRQPGRHVDAGGTFLFVADGPGGLPRQIGRSDGTAAGTFLYPEPADPEHLVRTASGGVYFRAEDAAHGMELWRYATDSVVAGRYAFYNNSALDGRGPGADARDDAAVARDKRPLLPGEVAGTANVTSYARGLNGIMVDLAALPPGATPGAGDFEFRAGTGPDPAAWALVAPATVSVRRGAGAGGSDRVTVTFPDGAVANAWLQVTVKPTPRTNLGRADVFYFGNLPGATGFATPGAAAGVGAADVLATQRAMRNRSAGAPADPRYDFNRDGRVDLLDLLTARRQYGRSLPFFGAPPAAGATP